jgi:hypothetical protein
MGFPRPIRLQPPGLAALAPPARRAGVAPPDPSVPLSWASGYTAARVSAAPLYLAERPGGQDSGPGASGPIRVPPPLDFRAAAGPPAPPLHADSRPAIAAAPSAPALDLEAVSRSVMSRIEMRLRVERERRGRC